MNTRIWIYSFIAVIFMASCGDGAESNATAVQTEQETFQSKQVQGHWTTDKNTAMELRAMQSTIENFNLLIKKQPQNLMAYQGYAATLKNHVNRTVTFCSLDKNARSLLCKSIDKISAQIEIIEKGDIKQAHDAAGKINSIFSEIDNSFNFSY